MKRGPVLASLSIVDTDTESQLSYASGPKSIRPTVKVAWKGGKKVDEENFLHMQEEYYKLKRAEKANEDTMRQLTAQLARTEEAAKRAMVARDPSAKGGAAQRLLDLECELSRVQADRTELEARYMKEHKRAGDFKTKSEELKRRLDTVLRDQRQLVQRVGNAEARRPRNSPLQSSLKSTDALMSAAHKQLAEQQLELDRLRQEMSTPKEAQQPSSNHHHGTEALEAQIRAAWDKANVLKTRFIETKNAFEQLKIQHARVIQELDTKVQGLHEQRMKQLSLERECSRLRQEVDRLAVLQPLLEAERNDRVRLEKENSSLMAKAFAAPTTALVELRGLKSEVYSLRRDKANAELREAEARRQLADLTTWGSRYEGQPAEMLRMQQELTAAHKLVAHLKIELDAAHSRLDIFRSLAPVQTSSQASQDLAGLQAFAATGEDHMRRELASLQSAYQSERLEGDKVRQLLAYEETRRCNLEESLDQAHKHAKDQQRDLQNRVAQLQQECTRLEQLVEDLDRQLVTRTGRQTGSQDRSSSEQQHHSASGAQVTDSIEDLADNENIIEVHVMGAELQCATGANFASFVELNFFEHATQATPVIQGRRPQYDTTVQFVVEMDSFLAEHKDSSCLALRLHHSNGYDDEPLGAACIPLPQLLSSSHLGLNSTTHSPCQHAQILGKHGEVLGSVEYAAAIHRPIPSMGQDSTALSAFHGGAILAEWNVDVGQPQEMHLGVVSDEEVGRSLSEHEDADSLIPSGSEDGDHQDNPEEQTAPTESQAPAASSRSLTADSVLYAGLGQTAAPSSALVHHPAGAQPSSTRTTTDSVLDRTLLEMESRSCTVSRQPSEVADTLAAPSDSRRHTADSVVDAVLREESVDSLLDGVLNEVVGAASRQRTTADSVLDAMLDDVSASRLLSQEGMPSHSDGHRIDQTPHLQQPDEQGEEGGSIYSSSPRAMLPSAAQPLSVRGRARYVGTDSMEGLQQAPLTQVCCPLTSTDPQDWPDLRSHVVICIESLEVAQSVQQDSSIQTIFVMYNFLPHFCQSAQEQCTEPAAKGHGALHYNHAVAYAVGHDSSQHLAARQEVQSQLHSPEGAVVPVCLVCDRVSEDTAASEDYHQFGFGEISLQAVLEQDRDLQHHQLPMLDAEQHHVGDLIVTVRAVEAFRSMHA
ncbi:hypothetical protein WJX82_006293 [Trebouxia sp. C0006]